MNTALVDLAQTCSRIETVPPKAYRPRTFPRGRVCAAARACPPGTRLSIYNGEDVCAQCEVAERREERRRERELSAADLMRQAPGPG
jgi:hypothetical protein